MSCLRKGFKANNGREARRYPGVYSGVCVICLWCSTGWWKCRWICKRLWQRNRLWNLCYQSTKEWALSVFSLSLFSPLLFLVFLLFLITRRIFDVGPCAPLITGWTALLSPRCLEGQSILWERGRQVCLSLSSPLCLQSRDMREPSLPWHDCNTDIDNVSFRIELCRAIAGNTPWTG